MYSLILRNFLFAKKSYRHIAANDASKIARKGGALSRDLVKSIENVAFSVGWGDVAA